jgi:hypothetical protein
VVDVTAFVHGVAPASAGPFVARLREWQAGGGKLEIASVQIQQSGVSATGRGTIDLTPTGHVEGDLRSRCHRYEPGCPVAIPNVQTRAIRPAEPQREPPKAQPTNPLEVQIRVEDGAIYIGPTLLGRIPSLF